MEVKNIHMTDEYAANYLLQQGYLAGRIEELKDTQPDWSDKHNIKEDVVHDVIKLLYDDLDDFRDYESLNKYRFVVTVIDKVGKYFSENPTANPYAKEVKNGD